MRSIDELTTVHLGGVRQWLRIMGSDLRNPILLLVPQGPGLPMIHEARRLERTLHLKDDFTVVYWDLRGCGLSMRDDNGAIDLNMDRLTTDAVELVDHLTTRFEQSTIVTGFSQGGTLALRAAARRPDLITAVVAVGPDIDDPTAERSAYHFALATARARRNRRALRALEGIGPPPHLTARQFRTRVRWVTNFGGVRLGATYRSIATTFVADILRSPAPSHAAGDAS
jgi:pimeloyl-ACP methyl ester carboxylesterase